MYSANTVLNAQRTQFMISNIIPVALWDADDLVLGINHNTLTVNRKIVEYRLFCDDNDG